MVVKTTSRFRHRKINFKVKLPIHTGSFEVLYDDQAIETAPGVAPEAAASGTQERPGVETGVDKDEESEVHLQKAINASAAALSARNGSTARAAALQATSASGRRETVAAAYIPTPAASGSVDDYAHLYPSHTFAEPTTYIRFSDMVEDVTGSRYTLDAEDILFLERYNGFLSAQQANVADASAAAGATDRARMSPRRERGSKETASPSMTLSADDFEALMSLFEQAADESLPLLDAAHMPTLLEMEHCLAATGLTCAPALQPFLASLFPHWSNRRARRDGQCIIPQLDYDESHEDTPYVCFRRREAKLVRKTRRTETHNMDRLQRLRSDLAQARDLASLVLEREKLKHALMREEAGIFEARWQLRHVKRVAQEADGDEHAWVLRERRKRRRITDDVAPASLLSAPQSGLTNGPHTTAKTFLRFPGRDIAGNVSPAALGAAGLGAAEPLHPYKDRTQLISGRIDKDMERKRAADREWEDYTDGAYCPRPPSPAARAYRQVDAIGPTPSDDAGRRGSPATRPVSFGSAASMSGLASREPAFRKRTGRGGRTWLDRLMPRDAPGNREATLASDWRRERWRHDSPATEAASSPGAAVLDDCALSHVLQRLALLRKGDLHSLSAPQIWLDQAAAYCGGERPLDTAVEVTGKLPGRIFSSAAEAHAALAHGMPLSAIPSILGQGILGPTGGMASQNAALVQQMLLAASHSQQLGAATQGPRRNPSALIGLPHIQPVPSSLPGRAPSRRPSATGGPHLNGVVPGAGHAFGAVAPHLQGHLTASGPPSLAAPAHLPNVSPPMPVRPPAMGGSALSDTGPLAGTVQHMSGATLPLGAQSPQLAHLAANAFGLHGVNGAPRLALPLLNGAASPAHGTFATVPGVRTPLPGPVRTLAHAALPAAAGVSLPSPSAASPVPPPRARRQTASLASPPANR